MGSCAVSAFRASKNLPQEQQVGPARKSPAVCQRRPGQRSAQIFLPEPIADSTHLGWPGADEPFAKGSPVEVTLAGETKGPPYGYCDPKATVTLKRQLSTRRRETRPLLVSRDGLPEGQLSVCWAHQENAESLASSSHFAVSAGRFRPTRTRSAAIGENDKCLQ